jgi:hypothetical protein
MPARGWPRRAKNLAAWLWIGLLLSVISLFPRAINVRKWAGAVLAVTARSTEGLR